jgi:uncharacterized protein (TIGR04255 family)
MTTPQNLEDIHYKKNYLKEVIARIDFVSPLTGITEQLPSKISSIVMKAFPIAEPQKATARSFQIAPQEVTAIDEEIMQWNFHGRNREKRLTILPNAIFVQYFSYTEFEVLEREYNSVLAKFFEVFPDAQIRRLGLRYINNIDLKRGKPFSWKEYLNEHLLHIFNFYTQHKDLSRIFNILEFNFNDFNLKYQFGMPNPDYPAAIKRRFYVMDFDAYYQGPQDLPEIYPNLRKFHDKIQELFELSITDTFREHLNE